MRGPGVQAAVRLTLFLMALSIAGTGFAQTDPAPASPPNQAEELEPRVVGAAGMMTVGFAGFVDRFNSTETLYPTNYTAQVDVTRFLTRRIAIRFGVLGTGSVGGEESADDATGPGAAALHVGGGGLFYFTPGSMVSAYAGVEYWAQVTHRADNDAGSAVGKFGFQAVISSRASVFVEGGYGVNLRRGEEGETITRIVGELGLRLRF
jgi:hypothetical protein